LYNLYGDIKFDENNLPKPMVPKSFNNCSTKLLDKKQYACPKLNGIRCLIYYENNQIKSSLNYTESLNNILNDNKLKNFFKKNPTIILDGEIYNHGFSYAQSFAGWTDAAEMEADLRHARDGYHLVD
jgi:ATP-dependent DNA ligase